MKHASLILKNGHIFSIADDGSRITGDAVAVKDHKIVKIGSNDEIEPLITEETEVIDCEGNTILPGLCDVHCHPSMAMTAMTGCDLFGIYRQEGQSTEEITAEYKKRLAEFLKGKEGSGLVRGTGWVIGNYMGVEGFPTRHDLDEVCPDRPVVLESFCQHYLWVNTKAIEIAGIDASTQDPGIGSIFREEDGYPAGVFHDPEAMDLIRYNVPGYDLSVAEYKEALLWYQREYANRYGVTMVQDCMHSDNAREAYRQLAEEGKLTLYARGVYHLEPGKREKQMEEFLSRLGSDNVGEAFRIDTLKMFSEGDFVMIDGYEKEYCREIGVSEDHNGMLYWPDEVFVEYASKAMEAGMQVHVHAMGDGSVKQSADCLCRAQKKAGKENARSVIAHLMLVPDETAKLMGKENIMGNCQPRWMVYDGDIIGMIDLIGRERSESAYPYRKLLDAGVRVAFGTDFPVTPPPDTMHEIQCAMTRQVFPDAPDYENLKGRVLGNEKAASLEEAVRSLSINGAYQIFAEEYTGSIEVGKTAELVILDRNIEETPVEEIYSTKVSRTIFNGKVVYEADSE